MSSPLAYLNGEILPEDQCLLRPQDTGFMLGVTVAEQLRTFAGSLFAWPAHEIRLRRSLEIVGLEVDLAEIKRAVDELVAHNYPQVAPSGDLGVTVFVTPGFYPAYAGNNDLGPTVGIHTYPLPFHHWARRYAAGQPCVLVDVPQVNPACWPRELKCRSRMHYFLADRQARARDADARAILLDQGLLNEASTANVVAFFPQEGLVSPRRETILPGVSLQYVAGLADDLGIPFVYRDITPTELDQATELLLTSTPFCLLPVSRLDACDYAERNCFQRLILAWSTRVGVDIVRQALASTTGS